MIAGGVETTAQGLLLMLMGCYEAQGYGIAKPLPASNFLNWLRSYQPNQRWLESGRRQCTIKENKVKFFRLIMEHWKNRFLLGIQSNPENNKHWPIMDSKHALVGPWIKQAKQEQLFVETVLARFEQAHEAIHLMANAMYQKYREGDVDEARARLGELKRVFNEPNLCIGSM